MITRQERLWLGCTGGLIVACVAMLAGISNRFGYDHAVVEMPIFALVGGLIGAGIAYAVAAWRVCLTVSDVALTSRLMMSVVGIGALARIVLAFSEPMLEDDYQRYLWDGAVTASGYNAYAIVPETAIGSPDPVLSALAKSAGLTLERVNHPELRTIYPPGAQAFFALAYKIKPFSLGAWRAVVMLADTATFALLLLLLNVAGRSYLWSLLYWWNPIVIKELSNSVHMDAVVMPFVLAAVWCAARNRPLAASVAVAAAGAIKIWPLALFPILVRAATDRQVVWIACAAVVGGITGLAAWPMIIAGLDQSAGVVAYAEKWRTNSAGFFVLLWLVEATGIPNLIEMTPNHVARVVVALAIVGAGLLLALDKPRSDETLIRRVGLMAMIIFLLSPAQFPWYVVWIAPFIAFLPAAGLIALAITMPLYYVAFHLMAVDAFPLFNRFVIWFVWTPVWGLLFLQALLRGPARRGREAAALTRRGR